MNPSDWIKAATLVTQHKKEAAMAEMDQLSVMLGFVSFLPTRFWLNSYEEKLEPSSSLTHTHYLFHNIQYKKNLENSYGAVYKVFI